MLKTLGIVEASAATPNSTEAELAHRRFEGRPLAEWVVRRVTESQWLDGVIVVAEKTPQGEQLAQLIPPDIPVFLSRARDPLARIVSATDDYPAVAVVRVDVHNPFVDPDLIDRLVRTAREHRNYDYISYRLSDGRPAVLSKLGLFAEWCRTEALRRADRETSGQIDRWSVTRYVYTHPETFYLRLIPIPERLDRHDVRLTIGGPEDLEHAEQIVDALGPECLDWQRIAGLLDQQPALRERMAVLNRTDPDL